ncbi:hypothetical protein L218DRAFT_994613 [Marasmius fiardii PR-910]|nr:hypothetical protein L218DRAFT_994613 [Marasmius fiardii PR-910]
MDYERTIGVFFITVCVASFLAGATTIQTYIYNVNYRKDPLILKAMVAVVWMLSMLHTTLLIYAVYDQTLKALSSTLIDTRLPRPAVASLMVSVRLSEPSPSTLQLTINLEYSDSLMPAVSLPSPKNKTYGLLKLGFSLHAYTSTFLVRWKSIAILVIFLCCITATFAACLTGIIRMFTFTFVFQAQILPLMTACFNISVDVSITAFLVWALMKSKTGLRESVYPSLQSDQALRIITIFSINTGLLPAVFATAGLISYLVVPNTYWYWFCIYLLSDTYANTILANLNSRTFFKERLHPSLNSTAGSNFIQNALQHIHSPTIFPTSGVCRDSIALEFDSSKTTRPTTAMTVVANWRDVADIDHELANDNMPPDRTAVAVI